MSALAGIDMQDGITLFEPLRGSRARYIVWDDAAPQLTPERMGAPRVPPALQIDTTSITCPSMRQGDQVVCPRCSIRWDVGENRPKCARNAVR